MRYVVSVLLMASGVTAILADWQRWWLACATDFDSAECGTLQSDWYDVVPPGEMWVPIGTAAPLMATSYALMAFAVLGLFRVVRPAWWSWVVGAVLAAPFGVLSATTYASAAAAHAVELPGTAATWPALTGVWPLALLTLAIVGIGRSGRAGWALAAVAGCLLLATPIALYFTAAIAVGYVSHDTSPWTQTIGGVLVVLAGVALLLVRPGAPVPASSDSGERRTGPQGVAAPAPTTPGARRGTVVPRAGTHRAG